MTATLQTARQWEYDPGRLLTIDGNKVPAETVRADYRAAMFAAAHDATAAQWADGLSWYPRASATAALVADAAGRPGNVAFGADLLAMLSQGTEWSHNVAVAFDVAIGMTADEITYQGYRDVLARAIEYRQTGNRDLVRGPKVCPFAVTICDPWAADIMPVFDRHMIGRRLTAWRNPKNIDRVGVRQALAMAIVDVASWYGHLPSAIQATVWTVVRPVRPSADAAARSLPVPF